MGVRYCGDSERRELFEKWRRPPKAEGRSDGRMEGGRDGLTSRRPHRRRTTESRTESGGRIGKKGELRCRTGDGGAEGRWSSGRLQVRTQDDHNRRGGAEGGGVGAFSRPTDDDGTQYTFEILMNWQLRLLKNGFFGPWLLFLSHSLS